MKGMFSCHVSIAHFLSRQRILSTFLGQVSPDGSSRLGRTWAWGGRWELLGRAVRAVGPPRSGEVIAPYPEVRSHSPARAGREIWDQI